MLKQSDTQRQDLFIYQYYYNEMQYFLLCVGSIEQRSKVDHDEPNAGSTKAQKSAVH